MLGWIYFKYTKPKNTFYNRYIIPLTKILKFRYNTYLRESQVAEQNHCSKPNKMILLIKLIYANG